MAEDERGSDKDRKYNFANIRNIYDDSIKLVDDRYNAVSNDIEGRKNGLFKSELKLKELVAENASAEDIRNYQALIIRDKADIEEQEKHFKVLGSRKKQLEDEKAAFLESFEKSPLSVLKKTLKDNEDTVQEAQNFIRATESAIKANMNINLTKYTDIMTPGNAEKRITKAEAEVVKQEKEIADLKAKISDTTLDRTERMKLKLDLGRAEGFLQGTKESLTKARETARKNKEYKKELDQDLEKLKKDIGTAASTAEEEAKRLADEAEKAKRELEKAGEDLSDEAKRKLKEAADEAKKMSDEAKQKAKEAMEKALKLKKGGKKGKDKGKGAKNKPDKPSPLQRAESVAGDVEEEAEAVEQEIEEVSSPIVRSIGRIPPSVYLLVMAIGGLALGATNPMPFVYFMIFMTLFYVVSSLHRRNQGRQSGRWF